MPESDIGMDILQLHSLSPKRPGCSQISPVAKRPKLSPEDRIQRDLAREAEKVAKEAERIAREAEKAAKEAEREAERAAKEAEKESKRLEREEKRRAKEEAKAKERQLKDEAKAKEVAAQEKKERAQLRMGNFFKKADPKPPAVLCKEESVVFKPFYLKEHVRLACRPEINNQHDDLFANEIKAGFRTPTTIASHFKTVHKVRARSHRKLPARTLRETLSEVSNRPLSERLQHVTYKLLQFHSDVRPPYFGTMTKTPSHAGLARGRQPYSKTAELNYDYDSEADWIQGDDEDAGEELGDDDDMSVASQDTYGDDSDDFLDDDETTKYTERGRQGGSLLPSILGIFTNADCAPVAHMRLQTLLNVTGPIDPFKNYWETDSEKLANPATKELSGILTTSTSSDNKSPVSLRKSSSTTSAFPDRFLPDFKKAIQGSNLTKILLVEKLRGDFKTHKISKKVIEDKLAEVAQRQGRGQHDVWTLRD